MSTVSPTTPTAEQSARNQIGGVYDAPATLVDSVASACGPGFSGEDILMTGSGWVLHQKDGAVLIVTHPRHPTASYKHIPQKSFKVLAKSSLCHDN